MVGDGGGKAPALAGSVIGADNVLLSGPCTELSRGGFRLRDADALCVNRLWPVRLAPSTKRSRFRDPPEAAALFLRS
jgi:hypothetical protein